MRGRRLDATLKQEKGGTMEFQMPNPRQVEAGLRALKTVGLADGSLGEAERTMLDSVQQIMGTAYDIDQLDAIAPRELAAAIADPQLRWQLCAGMIIMSFIDQDADGREADAVEKFAQALEVEERSVRNVRQMAEGRTRLVRFDVIRRFWAVDKIRQRIREEGLRVLWQSVQGARRRYQNDEMAARYRALENLAPGTLGRQYWEYMRENQFPLPGELGAAPETITFHDMTHVLSDYGTTPEEEIQIACFSAGFRKKEPLAFVLFVMLQFHFGLAIGPGVPTSRGLFDVGKALTAMRRGAAMNIDLTDTWKYWDVIDQPVAALRERYNIAPR